MKKKPIRITAVNNNDKKQAKILEKFLNYQWDKYEGVVSAITSARMYLKAVYNLETPESIWNKIMSEVVRLDVKRIEESSSPPPSKKEGL